MTRSALREIYRPMPDIELTEEPAIQVNNFMHGINRMPVRWTASSG